MLKLLVVFVACVACATAKLGFLAPKVFAAAPAAVAYANAPLYAAGGSSQIDVRHNYDGTFSSYTTVPFGYAGPYPSRYISGVPHATYGAKYVAPAGYAAPYAAGFAAPYAAPYAGSFASPYAVPYAAPYRTSYAAPYRATYASHYVSPYASSVIG